jgi:hypothetical protein
LALVFLNRYRFGVLEVRDRVTGKAPAASSLTPQEYETFFQKDVVLVIKTAVRAVLAFQHGGVIGNCFRHLTHFEFLSLISFVWLVQFANSKLAHFAIRELNKRLVTFDLHKGHHCARREARDASVVCLLGVNELDA